MIEQVLEKYISLNAREIQFRLGYQTIIKKNNEWTQGEFETLNMSEWEDLKDLCLKAEEKITLETKGQVRGLFINKEVLWNFSFVEWKNCLKAHFSYSPLSGHEISLQYPIFWEALRTKQGIHLITGGRGQGKTSFLKSVISETFKDSPELIVVHSATPLAVKNQQESLIQLGLESEKWDLNHPMYDGVDTLVLDKNDVQDWKKWIRFCEEGRRVFVTVSGTSVLEVLLQIWSDTQNDKGLWLRFVNQLSSVVNQKISQGVEASVQEVLVLKEAEKTKLRQIIDAIQLEQISGHHYQSYNQSIIQALVRRKIDVKAAFALSPNPDDLDQSLKKMGL